MAAGVENWGGVENCEDPHTFDQTYNHFRFHTPTSWRLLSKVRNLTDATSTFVLIRTRNQKWSISDEEMIDRYKGQFFNEQGFAWLKSGPSYKGLNPIFLATPKRIASLCFLYVVGLMVWALIQRTVRANLKKWNTGLPYHRNKPSDKITTRFFFELFPSIQTVPYSTPDGHEKVQVVGITPIIELACKALGSDIGVFQPKAPGK